MPAVRSNMGEVFALDKTPAAEAAVKAILRVRFSRSGPVLWLAHLDLMRTFERSVRRAGIPVTWSAGFNPRPDLVFALPIGVGLETCADYVDIGLSDLTMDAGMMVERLNETLPTGMKIIHGWEKPVTPESIMSRIAAADYLIEADGVAAAAALALNLPELMIDKPSKGRTLRVDIRPLALLMETDAPGQIRIRVKAGSRENLRPDLFLSALNLYGGLNPVAAADARLVRTGLYLSGTPADPAFADPEGNPMPPAPAACLSLVQTFLK